MKITDRKSHAVKCLLTLPAFEAEEKSEIPGASVMNSFYKRLESEIISYADSSDVRRYTADYTADATDGTVTVTVLLKARKVSDGGGLRTAKKELTARWRGTKLECLEVCEL